MTAKPKYRLLLLATALLVVACVIPGCSIASPQCQSEYDEVYSLYSNALTSAGNGHGYDYLDRETKRHYPMAHALIVSAESNRYIHSKDKSALETAIQHADWLVNNKDINEDNIIGWGLPEGWDAFGDGSENPAHTEYTITTALVIQGLLDVVDAVDRSGIYNNKKEAYLKTAQEALNSFIDNSFYTKNPDGTILFWYSSQPQDYYGVINVNAMFVGVLQRISNYPITEDKRSVYRYLADKGVRYLLKGKAEKDDGWYWNYLCEPLPASFKAHRENDLCHAAYVADGLLMYENCSGHLATEIDRTKILNGLGLFVEGDKVLEMFSRPELSPRNWGLGYFLYVISNYYPQEKETKDLVYQHILARQEDSGFRLTEDKGSPSDFVRFNAHILLGLSKYFWSDD